jgi:putative transposase
MNMSALAAGTVEAPDKNVRLKAGLKRSILDASWRDFARQLTDQVEGRGGRVILVNAAFTSRTCCMRRHASPENRKTQSVFCGLGCGHPENADVHAAKNILAAGHAVWSSESSADACAAEISRQRRASAAVAAPSKQEATEAKVLA